MLQFEEARRFVQKVHGEALKLYPENAVISVQLYGDLGHNPASKAVHGLEKMSKSTTSCPTCGDVDLDTVHLERDKFGSAKN